MNGMCNCMGTNFSAIYGYYSKSEGGARFSEIENAEIYFSVSIWFSHFAVSCYFWDLVLDIILGLNFGPTTNATDGSCSPINVALHVSAQSGKRVGQCTTQLVF